MSSQSLEQGLGVLQIGRIEAFSEPIEQRGQQIIGFCIPALVAPEAGEADRGAEFEEFGRLTLGERCGPAKQVLRLHRIALSSSNYKFAPTAVQLGAAPCFTGLGHNAQSRIDCAKGILATSISRVGI